MGRQERERSPFAVVYHRCPSCHEAAVETEAGRVEVTASAIDRVEPSAELVPVEPEPELPGPERDRPNTPRMRFVIRTRDGGRCSNPHCRRLVGAGGHCHHILTRSVRENLEKLVQQASFRVLDTPVASDFPDDVMATACKALEVLGCTARQARAETAQAWNRLLGAGNDRAAISAEALIRETCRRC